MTEREGITYYQIHPKAITSIEFADFLRKLQRKYRTRRLAILMDNLTVHKSQDIKPLYEQLNIMPIFNVGYSPEFNPIESVFSKVKAIFN